MRRILLSIILLVSLSFSNAVLAAGAPAVRVIYFHGLHRCPTCIAIERETKATIENDLKEMVKAKKVAMEVFTIEDAKNQDLVKKYDIWGSTLLIVDEKGNKLADLTEEGFSMARTQPEKFRSLLKAKIQGFIKQ
jgi:hypothetical protein